jgi:hypothetical protein
MSSVNERLQPAALKAAVIAAVYGVRPGFGAQLFAENPDQNYRARFEEDSVVFESSQDKWSLRLTLRAVGYGDRLIPTERASVHAAGNRVEFRRRGLSEWYVNGEGGVRQWFRIDQRPNSGLIHGPLRIAIDVNGLSPRLRGDGVDLIASDGSNRATYRGLAAWDARGIRLDARMEVEGDDVVLAVQDEGAVYPLTIDPIVQQAKLLAVDGEANDNFGYSVAIDGNTAVVGAPFEDPVFTTDAGSVYVFVRSGSSWTQQAKIANPSSNTSDFFGWDVAVQGDTIVVGAPLDDVVNTDNGNVWVYQRTGTLWNLIQRIDNPFTSQSGTQFGYAVALDGNDLAVGFPFLDNNTTDEGGVSVHRRSGPGNPFSSVVFNVDSPFNQSSEWFGFDVAINSTQGILIIGNPRNSNFGSRVGQVCVYVGGNYGSRNQDIGPNSAQNESRFGQAVDLSRGSGQLTLAIGQPLWDNAANDQGRAEVWIGSTTYSRQQVIENPDPTSAGNNENFGNSVAVAGDFLAVGSPGDDNARGTDAGAVHTFRRVSGAYAQITKLIPSDLSASDRFGFAVCLGDDFTLITGATLDDDRGTDSGSAYVFIANTAPTIQSIPNQNAAERTPFTVTAIGQDADSGQTLTYSLTGTPPAGMTIDATTGVISWTPSETQGGQNFSVTVRVTDDGLPPLFAETTFQVAVAETNEAPTLAAIANQNVSEGSLLSLTAVGADEDLPAQTLTYSLQGTVPQGAQINATTGVFTWSPAENQGPGSFPITIRVTDNGSPVRFAERTFTVVVAEVNQAPTLDAIPNQIAREEEPLIFTATASDSDLPANSLTFSLVGAPTGATINPTTGVFTWTPSEADGPGQFSFTVRVTDNGDPALSADRTVQVTVLEVQQIQVDLSGRYFSPNGSATASTTDLSANNQVIEPSGAAEGTFTPYSDADKKPRALRGDLRSRSFRYEIDLTGTWSISGDRLLVVAGDPQAGGLTQTFTRAAGGFVVTQGTNQLVDNTNATRFRVQTFVTSGGTATTLVTRLNGSASGTVVTLGATSGLALEDAGFRTTIEGQAGSLASATLSGFTTSLNPPNALVLFAAEPFAQPGGIIDYELNVAGLQTPVVAYQAFLGFTNAQTFNAGSYTNFPFPNFFQPLENTFPTLAAGVNFDQSPTTSEGKLADIRMNAVQAAATRMTFRTNNPPSRFSDNEGNPVTPTLVDSNVVVIEQTPPTITNIRATQGGGNLIGGNVDTGLLTFTVSVADLGAIRSGLRQRPTFTVQFASGSPVSLVVSHLGGNDFVATIPINKTTPNGNATITVSAVDDAGNSASVAAGFRVSQAQVVIALTVQGLTGNVTRAIDFVVGGSGGSNNAVVIPPFNVNFVNGQATVVLDVTDGLTRGSAYTRISAKDRLHTLRRRVDLVAGPDPDQFTASITVKSGDATNDNLIDVRDYGAIAGQFGQNVGRDTPANFGGNLHADFSGNGLVGTEDVTFVVNAGQFLSIGDPVPGGFGRPEVPLKRATIEQMKGAGVPDPEQFDLDRDGWVTIEEITTWLKRFAK